MHLLMTTYTIDEQDPHAGFITDWARALAARVDHLTIICQSCGAAALPTNVAVHSMGKERGRGRPGQLLAFYRAAWRAVPACDAIFCHLIPRYAWLIAPLARLRGRPLNLWFTHRSTSLELRLAHAAAARVFTAVPDSFPFQSSKVAVVGHGIDAARFHPPDHAVERPARPQVVIASRLSPSKYHHTMIEAAALMARQGAGEVDFFVLGHDTPEAPAYRAELEAEIKRCGLADRFTFTGGVPQADLPAIYYRASAAINLAPPGHFDKAPLEAMLCGTPAIVASEAFAPVLGQYTDALLIDGPKDVEGLAARLTTLLAMDEAGRAQIGADLQRATHDAHDLDALMDRLVQMMARRT
jgi:glycosyltransferase involved in cell wall biosynthesis